ncbi:FAD-binding oxidoreductase [Pseudonocardia sp. MH-G8]|uniref:FAD-binding oxidoreductase n=1 Tax=Pseudonocardia sp. MH-G8 TaxID=1854588 RepID=UPI000BA0282F|nr:FAD-binding oxidoreductase [Pseudonocardia sp. MH-G8]OZM80500.1 FAD-dependent oxygenase [Pseudonocardia sp. MH-G8]
MTNFLSPGDQGYDTGRTGYNLAVDHKPEVVVPAASVDDVVAAIRYATTRGLGVAVQATGHGPSRSADGSVLINTSRMDGITIDPVARTARVEAGVRGSALVRAAAEHGLAPLNGSSPEVGVVSYHLGGGIGMLGRSLGWAVDHVRALEVVTADGVLRRASATEETELFWALRGGGKGTLGVVVAIEIDLHPVARLYGGGMHFAATDAERVLTTWAEWARTAPESMGSSVLLIRMPDLPVLPDALRGRYVVHLRFAFTGSAEEGTRLVRPFRDLVGGGRPMSDTVVEMPYSAVGSIHAEPTTPVPFHARNTMLASLDAAAVAELLRHAGPDADAPHLVELRLMGGALARPGAVPSALARRDGAFVLYAGATAEPERVPAVHAAYDRLFTAMAPWSTGGACVNFLSGPDVTAAQLATAYLPADVDRLAAVKRAVDPGDVFRTHHGRADRPGAM